MSLSETSWIPWQLYLVSFYHPESFSRILMSSLFVNLCSFAIFQFPEYSSLLAHFSWYFSSLTAEVKDSQFM
jgi:hypothetical protein